MVRQARAVAPGTLADADCSRPVKFSTSSMVRQCRKITVASLWAALGSARLPIALIFASALVSECEMERRKRPTRGVRSVRSSAVEARRCACWALGQPAAMRSSVWVSHALGSTSFRRAVASRDAIVAHVSPPASDPTNRAFLRVIVTGRIARSTLLLSSSTRPSARSPESCRCLPR